ncbi:hypothetical protein O181_064654 [Austropuccinia psidii MF-1]|uniref:Uncharacterized protein n=1 Tax=Austropuccinia psidii MF-1 TaxID=1389203 RepID=A0A9Q3EPJ4_9BASI|nr:hypothetical protein [Austropuccinia psidii MF-1]
MTNTCDACQQAQKKFSFVGQPFQPRGQRSSCPRFPCKDSSVVNNDESIPEMEWTLGAQTGPRKQFLVNALLDQSEVIIWPMKDGNGERTFKLGPIITMSCHPWDSNAKVNFIFLLNSFLFTQ